MRLALVGEDHAAEIGVIPLLSFYAIYQSAEDDAIELKLAKGLETGKYFFKMNLHFGLLVFITFFIIFRF